MAATVIATEEVVCPVCDEARQHPVTTACMRACPSCMRALIMFVNGLATLAELPEPVRAAINREVANGTAS